MTLTPGIISLISAGSNSAKLSATSASGGVPPYTQQWHRSVDAGFFPDSSNAIPNATGLILNDTGLIPNQTYFYKVVYFDSVISAATSDLFTMTTLPASQSMNQFATEAILGDLDLKVGGNVVTVQIDASQLTPLYPGQPVKFVNSPYGIPTVVAAGTSMPNGYIAYDPKSPSFSAGSICEIARTQSCMWLYATSPISRGAMVVLDSVIKSGVTQATGSSSLPIIGEAFDQATASGQLIRIILNVPSNMFDTNVDRKNFIPPTQQIFLSGSGIYTPTVADKPVLYFKLQMWGAGGGGAGSGTGAPTGGNGQDGGATNFGGILLFAFGGGGGTFTEAGIGGGYDIEFPVDAIAFNGQNGAVNDGVIYDTLFSTAPNKLINFLPGGAGGNSFFPGGGQSFHQLDAVQNSGAGGGGASVSTDSTIDLVWNSGMGGGGGGYIECIIKDVQPFSYNVGIGGDGGTAGTHGAAGGRGANGGIVITEYYQ